jgi:integrase
MQLNSITPTHVRTAFNDRSRAAAPATVARDFAALRAVFNAAVNDDLISRSPARKVIPQALSPRHARILTAEELERLAESLKGDRLMPYLAVVLSLRWGEIAGLRIGALNLSRCTISIAEQRTRGGKGRMIDAAPKTSAGVRTLAAPEWLMRMLSAHLANRGVTEADRNVYVFAAPRGGPLHYSNWRIRVWEPAVKLAGLHGLHFHDLRKTAATALVAAGVDLKTAQRRLGHANPQVTLRVYAQVTEESDRAAAEKIGSVFRPRTGTDRKGPDVARRL